MKRSNFHWIAFLSLACLLIVPASAQAYIGPGAGFALGSSLFAFMAAMFSGLVAIFLWPARRLFRFVRGRKAFARARVKRVVILGLDGMEPSLAEQYMAQGKMPNLSKLAAKGSYQKLATTAPPLSPVAWSTFLTGCNPGKHNIFDFLTRDVRTYLPLLSSVNIVPDAVPRRIGPIRLPGRKADIRLLRKGKPFWNVLGEHGIFSNVIRVPITFPPERFRGVLLSAMCVPDLRGTQGTFSFYSTRKGAGEEYIGGEQIAVTREENIIRSHLVGPAGPDGKPLQCPFEVTIIDAKRATLEVSGERHDLIAGTYTAWVPVSFSAGVGKTVRGICEFLLLSAEPDFQLYATPIQIDPDHPAMPISHPSVYSTYLAKSQGRFATLGLAEDTWGLNAKILDDDGFLHQCLEADSEREKMFFDALDKVRHGLCVCVFDGTDRIQHMFWRYIDPKHPAHEGQGENQRRDAIAELYARMDELVGKTMAQCDRDDTLVMVISDHGFNSFRRGVDLNVWLEHNGYLALKPDGRGKKYLAGVDWSRTRAYCVGLAGLWLNIRGREVNGTVDPKEADALRDEICEKLGKLIDPVSGTSAVSRAFNSRKIYDGPYAAQAPDVIVGYNKDYRVSWEAAIGQPTDNIFHDNNKAWSGDHCIDPKLIPGVFFCNRKIESQQPRLMDLGPTVLDLFGVDVPGHMDGKPLTVSIPKASHRRAASPPAKAGSPPSASPLAKGGTKGGSASSVSANSGSKV